MMLPSISMLSLADLNAPKPTPMGTILGFHPHLASYDQLLPSPPSSSSSSSSSSSVSSPLTSANNVINPNGANQFVHDLEITREEKMRLCRERNRLHAQRTRTRKRQLLENLKERIRFLIKEREALQEMYEIHLTAASLWSLAQKKPLEVHALLDSLSNGGVASKGSARHALLTSNLNLHNLFHGKWSSIQQEIAEIMDHDPASSGGSEHEHDGDEESLSLSSPKLSPANCSLMTKEDRDQLRRERNRLHARRARLRKKMMLEKTREMAEQLHDQNDSLREKLGELLMEVRGDQDMDLDALVQAKMA